MKNRIFICVLAFITAICAATVFACNHYYTVEHKNGLYIVKISDINKIEPYVSDKLETVYDIATKNDAKVAINAGFFDAKNQKTVSYVSKNDEIIVTPEDNENLTSNETLIPHLNKIYNRAEFRILNCENSGLTPIVALHNDNYNKNCKSVFSIQAGPALLPDMDLEKEFFLLKSNGKVIRDAVGVERKTDRSAIAVKNNIVYFIITDEITPCTIYELRKKLQELKFEQAMAFDGGGSVSLFVKEKDRIFYQDREEKGASRKIKSALIVK